MTMKTILDKGCDMIRVTGGRKMNWAKTTRSFAFIAAMVMLALALALSQSSNIMANTLPPPLPDPDQEPVPPGCDGGGSGGGSDGCDCPCPPCPSCPSDQDPCDSSGTGETGASNPVRYATGVTVQKMVDINIPGTGMSYVSARRSNNRLVSSVTSRNLAALGGARMVSTLESFVTEDTTGHANVYIGGQRQRFTLSGGVYVPSDGKHWTLTKDTSAHEYVAKFLDTGVQYKFAYSTTTGVPDGVLKSKSNRRGATESYTYSSTTCGGRITTVTTANNSQVTNTYVSSGLNVGKIASVSVRDTDGVLIQKVNYTYCVAGSFHADAGTTGDLLMVETLKRATDDPAGTLSIRSVVMYRYYNNSSSDGREHQLKMEFSPEAVQQIMADNAGNNFTTESQILAQADSFTVAGSRQLSQYATKIITYYVQNYNTGTQQDSTWPIDSTTTFNTRYSTADFDEIGYVKSELIRSGCGSCGGGSTNGITNNLYYMNLNSGPTNDANRNPSVSYRVTVKDTLDGNGTFVKREIFGLNNNGAKLRKVTAVVQNGSAYYWCESYIFGTSGGNSHKIIEKRPVSAHTRIATLDDIRMFLNPTGNGGQNETDTLNAAGTGGYVNLYEHDSGGYLAYEKIKDIKGNGSTSQTYMVKAFEYGDGSNNRRDLVMAEYSYPQLVTSATDNSRTAITYEYTYHQTGGQNDLDKTKTKTTTYPQVSTSNHGSGTATVVKEYYDADGQLRWKKDADGYVTYYAYNPATGGLAYKMVDVDTSDLSALAGTDGGRRTAWSGGIPSGFTRTGTSATKLQLVTKYEYDALGRETMSEDPDGIRTYTAYGNTPDGKSKQTVVYPGCIKVASNPDRYSSKLPVQVKVTDGDKKTFRQYSLDMSGTTFEFSGTMPSTSSISLSNYTSFTRNNYDEHGLLSSVDQFYDIPHTGDPTLSTFGTLDTNFFRTAYSYDEQGRRFQTTSPEGTISITQYDLLGRSIGKWVGTDATGATSLNPSGTSGNNNMVCSSRDFYDSATTAALAIGDGKVTSSLKYSGTGSSDYYKTENVYDWRGKLDRSRGPDKVVTKYTYDNLGYVTATRVYAGDVENDWKTYADDQLDSNGKLRAKSASSYDEKGQLYLTTLYEVGTNGTIGSGTMATGYWYDASGKTIKVKGPDNVFDKTMYDGAGRALASIRSYDANEADTDYSSAGLIGSDTVLSITFNQYSGTRQVATWQGVTLGSAPVWDNPNGGGGGDLKVTNKILYDTDYDGTGQNMPYVMASASLKATATLSGNDSDYLLVKYEYNGAGLASTVIKPYPGTSLETVTAAGYDDLGREKTTTMSLRSGGSTYTQESYAENVYTRTQLTARKVYRENTASPSDYVATTYGYDTFGRQCKVTQPSGAFTKTTYNLAGQVTGQYLGTDEGSTSAIDDDTFVEQTLYSYDATTGQKWLTQKFQRKDNDTSSTNVLTTSNSRVTYDVAWFDDMGRARKTVNYGTNGGTAITTLPSEPNPNTSNAYMVAVTEYNGFGQVDTRTDNRGIKTKLAYDSAGRQTYTIENFQSGSSYWGQTGGSDDYSQPLARISTPDVNRITKNVYDDAGRLWKLVALDPKCDGNAAGCTADNQETIYSYSSGAAGDCAVPRTDIVTKVQYPDGNGSADNIQTAYCANGAVSTRTDQRGVIHTFTYDTIGRLTRDAASNLPSGVDGTIRSITYGYSVLGRVSLISSLDATNTVRNEVQVSYDTWGNPQGLHEAHNGDMSSNEWYATYTYAEPAGNAGGLNPRVRQFSFPDATQFYYNYPSSGIGAVLNRLDNIAHFSNGNGKYVQYGYLGAGTIIKVLPGGLALNYDPAGNQTYSALDNLGRVIQQKWTNSDGSVVKDQFDYAYDNGGNRLYRENAVNSAFSELYHSNTASAGAEYDGLSRLTQWRRGTLSQDKSQITSASKYQSYLLDGLGNWDIFNDNGTTQTRTNNTANEILTLADTTGPAYDLAGNMTNDAQSHTYRYDAWNRLTAVYSDLAMTTTVATYKYDGRNYRIAKTVGNDTFDYYYNTNWQVLEERKNGSRTAYAKYVWDLRYIDAPVLRWRVDGAVSDTLYYTTDANMNVTALVNASSGNVVERTIYDAYGQPTFLDGSWNLQGGTGTASAFANEILYCGYRYNAETGNYQVRNREYQPGLGRWLQRDPIEYGDWMNLYLYCGSMPVLFADPYGTVTTDPFKIYLYGQPYWVVHTYTTHWDGSETCVTTYFEYSTDGVDYIINEANMQNLRYSLAGQNLAVLAGQIATVGSVVIEGIQLAIPGLDDVIIGKLGGKLAEMGLELICDGGKLMLRKGGKALCKDDAAKAAKELAEAIENAKNERIGEAFRKPADAIGDLHGEAKLVGNGVTKNGFWTNQGFTKTEYYVDSNGIKWTVFKNPKTGEYSGAHPSSGQ
jgi:RHS repeat-associated protein